MKKLILAVGLLACVSITVAAQHHAIRVEKIGSGTPLIFLPGFTSPGSVWNETVTHLTGKYEAHLVSYAGFNGIKPIEMPWYDAIKQEVIQYITSRKLQHVVLIGHSMGGTLAADIAAELPAPVLDKLILVDALPCMRELMMPGVSASQLTYESPYNQQLLALAPEAFLQQARLMAENMTVTKAKVDTLVNWSVKADRKTYVYGYTDLLKTDVRDGLANIHVKTLLVAAAFPNQEVVTATMEKQYAKLPNKTLVIAPGSKHFIMFDQPQWFYNQVNTFLAQ